MEELELLTNINIMIKDIVTSKIMDGRFIKKPSTGIKRENIILKFEV